MDGFWRLAYTEVFTDEKATTTIGLFCRSNVFLAAHGITRVHRVVIDNGANYRVKDSTRCVEALAYRHQRIRPYMPRHKCKVEWDSCLMANEVLYVRPYPGERARWSATNIWVKSFNPTDRVPPAMTSPRPRASRPAVITSCPLTPSLYSRWLSFWFDCPM